MPRRMDRIFSRLIRCANGIDTARVKIGKLRKFATLIAGLEETRGLEIFVLARPGKARNFAELAKTLPPSWTLHYWRAKGGAEMDFVLVRGEPGQRRHDRQRGRESTCSLVAAAAEPGELDRPGDGTLPAARGPDHPGRFPARVHRNFRGHDLPVDAARFDRLFDRFAHPGFQAPWFFWRSLQRTPEAVIIFLPQSAQIAQS